VSLPCAYGFRDEGSLVKGTAFRRGPSRVPLGGRLKYLPISASATVAAAMFRPQDRSRFQARWLGCIGVGRGFGRWGRMASGWSAMLRGEGVGEYVGLELVVEFCGKADDGLDLRCSTT
jgi:hypothetical protein